MVAKYRSVLSIPGCARVFTTALRRWSRPARFPRGWSPPCWRAWRSPRRSRACTPWWAGSSARAL